METLTYKDQLRDPLWQKKRLTILERDNFRCSLCGDDRTNLQIHHKKYINGLMPWEYPDETLATLCNCCHAFVELNKRIHGFLIEDFKAVYIRIPKSTLSIRLYRLNETIVLYLFNQDSKIVTSYDVSSCFDGLSEFLK